VTCPLATVHTDVVAEEKIAVKALDVDATKLNGLMPSNLLAIEPKVIV
jgi:hypothetical protein